MQKIYINKITNMVEQILKEAEGENFNEDYFPTCYMVEDIEENIKSYNIRYNKEERIFEVVEGLPERNEVEIIPKVSAIDIENLKKENEDIKREKDELAARLKKIENLLNVE